MKKDSAALGERIVVERKHLLSQFEDWLDTPMLILGFAWLALLIYEFTWDLTPVLELAGTIIWIIFIIDFSIRFSLAPDKTDYLKANWLTALALIVPATGVPEQADGADPENSSAPISGVLPFRESPSKSVVIPATGAPAPSRSVGLAGSKCKKFAELPFVLKKLTLSVTELASRGATLVL